MSPHVAWQRGGEARVVSLRHRCGRWLGPKIPGTDVPLFDPGLINQMSAGISDISSPYVLPTPAATPAASQ